MTKRIVVDWDESTGQVTLPNKTPGFPPWYLCYFSAVPDGYEIEEAVDLRAINSKLDELLRRTQGGGV